MSFYDQPGRDGRRKSDPLKTIVTNPALAPDLQLVRLVASDDDFMSQAVKSNGVNFGRFRTGCFQIVPLADDDLDSPSLGTANVSVEMMAWCPLLGRFIHANPVATYTGLGAGIPYELEFASDGLIIMPSVTGTAGGTEVVAVYAAGYVPYYMP